MKGKSEQDQYTIKIINDKDKKGNNITLYFIQGKKCPDGIEHIYKDFELLHKKLQEKWPWLYIPKILPSSHLKINTLHNTLTGLSIETEIYLIKYFLLSLSNIKYLNDSEDLDLFFKLNYNEYSKKINEDSHKAHNNISPSDLFKKYSYYLIQYDYNFDIKQGKIEQKKCYNDSINLLKRSNVLLSFIESLENNWSNNINCELNVINSFKGFENDTIKELYSIKNSDIKEILVFSNESNYCLTKSIKKLNNNIANPYKNVYIKLVEQIVYIESMIETLDSFESLKERFFKISKSYSNYSIKLLEKQKHNCNDIDEIKSIKEKVEKEMDSYENLIKIVYYNIDIKIREYKDNILDTYYKSMFSMLYSNMNNEQLYQEFCENLNQNEILEKIQVIP